LEEDVHNISIKYYYNPTEPPTPHGLIPARECYIDGKPGEILDPELNIVEFKVFDD